MLKKRTAPHFITILWSEAFPVTPKILMKSFLNVTICPVVICIVILFLSAMDGCENDVEAELAKKIVENVKEGVMSRSRKDGRWGGGHTRAVSARRCYKKMVRRNQRRKDKEIALEESTEHLRSEGLARLKLPTLDYRVYVDVTRALSASENSDRLLKSLVTIADKSNLMDDNTYLRGVLAVVENENAWIRTLDSWHAESLDRGEQFSELTRHLLCEYEVPRFMDIAWLNGNTTHQGWFRHIGTGENIRMAPGLPFVLTKRASGFFMKAPQHYTIEAALRFGQVTALGGNRHLMEMLRDTYIVRVLRRHSPPCDFWFEEEDTFWRSVIRFFIEHPVFDRSEVRSIVDYLRYQKYGDPQRRIPPAHPNLSMNRRTPALLLKQMEAEQQREKKQWRASGISEYRGEEWCIRELRSTSELKAEGDSMKHCVSMYSEICHNRTHSIWTLETVDGKKKAATIAVELPDLITEFRGKRNSVPTREAEHFLIDWAEKNGLYIPYWM